MTTLAMTNKLTRRRNMAHRQEERWRPPLHVSGKSGLQRVVSLSRRFLDLQMASIWADVSAELPNVRGTVLDVGCGSQPFRELVNSAARYEAIDTAQAKAHFGYEAPDTTYYEGNVWPIPNASVDFLLCTETLEHVQDPAAFLSEAHRCLVPSRRLFLTVPFAARWHFIPHDYWRFTPSSLKQLLTSAGFEDIAVFPRGNAVTVACYKLMALLLPLLLPQAQRTLAAVCLRLIALPFIPAFLLLALIGNLSMIGKGGDDCLGYTVVANKR